MKSTKPAVYAVKHKDETIRAASRSGGMFTALSDEILMSHGVVYGCILTDTFEAVHVRAECIEDRNKMRGSKYIQSSMEDVFSSVKIDLESGILVLFSGTSCQIAGLRGYLGASHKVAYENLICVDIVCHGVPSPLVWKDYLRWQEKRNKSRITRVNFRNKTDFGWADHVESLYFENGRQSDSRIFTTMFYSHVILRPCCYQCPYKDIMHPGDITIADYWGVDIAVPGFDDNKGVSLVLINNDVGKVLFKAVESNLIFVETRIEDSMQPPFVAPFKFPDNRERFWRDFQSMDFERLSRRYGDYGLISNARKILKRAKDRIK